MWLTRGRLTEAWTVSTECGESASVISTFLVYRYLSPTAFISATVTVMSLMAATVGPALATETFSAAAALSGVRDLRVKACVHACRLCTCARARAVNTRSGVGAASHVSHQEDSAKVHSTRMHMQDMYLRPTSKQLQGM